MPSTYTSGLGVELIANGEQASSWGQTTNKNLGFIDKAIYGSASVTLSGATYTLDIQDGASCTARNTYLKFIGSPGGNCTVTISPNNYQRVFTANNGTAYDLIFTQGSGGDLTIPAGASAVVVADGAGSGAAVVGASIDPLAEKITFKTSTQPTMDGVGRLYRDTNGMRYDGLSHQFDVGSGPARVTAVYAKSDGTVGVGTTTPGRTLEVASSSVAGVRVSGNGFETIEMTPPTGYGYRVTLNNDDSLLVQKSNNKFATSSDTVAKFSSSNVEFFGSAKATSYKIGNNTISYASSIPTSSGTQGDICFNTAVAAGGTLGWVCTGGTTWKIFGIVAA